MAIDCGEIILPVTPPVVSAATPYAAVYKFDWLSATGTAILFAALLSIVWLRMKPK
ncbi:L-lactate permease, partial [Klebsiella pneumoniae]|uniref:L-lactate permease n=1 Tax=Klebsiella pneumoniae TaxID=573 RepID=UPI003EE2D733